MEQISWNRWYIRVYTVPNLCSIFGRPCQTFSSLTRQFPSHPGFMDFTGKTVTYCYSFGGANRGKILSSWHGFCRSNAQGLYPLERSFAYRLLQLFWRKWILWWPFALFSQYLRKITKKFTPDLSGKIECDILRWRLLKGSRPCFLHEEFVKLGWYLWNYLFLLPLFMACGRWRFQASIVYLDNWIYFS